MTIRVGVVGAGFIGRDHLAAYSGWPDARIVGVADVDVERAQAAAAPFGARALPGLATMAREAGLDAVSVHMRRTSAHVRPRFPSPLFPPADAPSRDSAAGGIHRPYQSLGGGNRARRPRGDNRDQRAHPTPPTM
jgi:Oxidoreductase family, NAD-binding Rossmann fold